MGRALDMQVGGDHYKKLKIQPVEYIVANNIGYLEGNVIKYITRWRDKGGVRDLEKAKHYIEMLIELQNTKTKDALSERAQEERKKLDSVSSEQICVEDADLPQHGFTRHEAIKNLLKEYKRVIVRYKENVTDKELQHVADNLRGLSLDIVRESIRPDRFGICVHYAKRETAF